MRLFVAGQKYFGALVLAMCLEAGYEVAGVSAPAYAGDRQDDPDARPDRLRALAGLGGIPWMRAGQLRAELLPAGVDLIVAAHSYDFIGRKTRNATRLGAIGFHPSMLPMHRGRDAVRWAVKMGDRITGGSVFWLTDGVDAGPIAAQDWCFIRPGDTADKLWRRDLQPMGVSLIKRTLEDLTRGVIVAVDQDHTLASWEPSWERAPLFRPELPQIGAPPAGYRVVKTRGAA